MKKSSIIAGVIVTIATALSLKSNLVYAADGIPAITAGTSGLPRMDVVDVSSNNGNISIASFQKMHQYGVGAVIVKLTEATSYRNPYAATQIANAKAAGLKIGAYHYSWYTSQSSAQSEAKYFTDYAKSLKLPSDTLMVDDLEDTYTMTNNVTNNAKAFNTQVKATGFSNTSTYTGLYYKNTTGLNFSYIGNDRAWIAQYPFAPSSNSLWNTTYGMWQWNSNTSFPGVSGTFDVSIDYTNLITQVAKYKVGDVVKIASNAWSETNGYTLVNRRDWVGTVVSAKPKAYSNSAWEYDIQYSNGVHSVHVAEQDVTTIAAAKYSVGQTVKIASNAWSETNGYTLVNRRDWVGTVVSAKPKAYSNSAWEYGIQYSNGVHSVHVAEQDVTTIAAAKYSVGQTVKIASNAWSETNGYTLVNRRDWVGTVVSAKPKAYSNSAWEYDIQYSNGVHSVHVAEQDVTTIAAAKYSVGQTVKIASNAWSETNGYTLVNRRDWVGTVISAKPKAYSNSAWEYDIQYSNGVHSVHVAEQDVTTIAAAKYSVGQTVKIASNAWSETNGYTLVNRRDWVGTVVSAKPKAYSNSAWEYDIQYSNGVHSVHVAEQDVTKK